MIKAFFVDRFAQGNGKHEVHRSYCAFLARQQDLREGLGEFDSVEGAVAEARRRDYPAKACVFCNEIRTVASSSHVRSADDAEVVVLEPCAQEPGCPPRHAQDRATG